MSLLLLFNGVSAPPPIIIPPILPPPIVNPPGPVPPFPGPVKPKFAYYGGVTVPQPVGQIPLAYLIRSDTNQISALDTRSSSPIDFALYRCHTFTGEETHRNLRKRLVRVLVWGDGAINTAPGSAYMFVTADSKRSDVYAYSAQSPDPAQGLLWSQGTLSLVGRTIDVMLFLTGTGIAIREIEIQYIVVG